MARPNAMPEPEAEVMPRSEAEALKVDVVPGRRAALCGVKNTVRVVMRIRTPEDTTEPDAPRPPVSVACVLDRSGSMHGQKLDFAKRACKKLVKHLGTADTLHFIAYDGVAQVVFENGDLSEAGKEELKSRIGAVTPGGLTDLCAGLESAASLMAREAEGGVRRIFLFSDGCVTAGVKDPVEIKRRVAAWADAGITTTTFGIGADFDEPLMRGIAEAGKGRYTFLATPLDIPRLVSKSIHDLLKLYASEALLDVRGGAHTIVSKIYSGGGDEDDGVATDGLLQLGDLHSANERMVLFELDAAPPGDCADGLGFAAAEWTLSFQRNGTQAQFSGRVDLVATKQRAALRNEAASVRALFSMRQASDLELEVAELLGRGARARAKEAKGRQLALLRGALEAARGTGRVEPADTEALEAVLRRAERVAERLHDGEDSELVRRHCVQECDLARAMSIGGFSSGCDSPDGSEPGGEQWQQRLRDFDDPEDGNNGVSFVLTFSSPEGLQDFDDPEDGDSDGGHSSGSLPRAVTASPAPPRTASRREAGGCSM